MFSYKVKMSFFDRLMFLLTNENVIIKKLVHNERVIAYRAGKHSGVKMATKLAIESTKKLAKYDVKTKIIDTCVDDLDVFIGYRINNFYRF